MDFSNLEAALGLIFGTFCKYRGANEKLDKVAFKMLLSEQMPHFPQNQEDMDSFYKLMDQDQDGKVDFAEYSRMIAMFSMLQYDILQSISQQSTQ